MWKLGATAPFLQQQQLLYQLKHSLKVAAIYPLSSIHTMTSPSPPPKHHSVNSTLIAWVSCFVTYIDLRESTACKLRMLTTIFLSLDKTGNKCLLTVNFIKCPRKGQLLLNWSSPTKLRGITTKKDFRYTIFQHINKF